MADDVDMTSEKDAVSLDAKIRAIHNRAALIPVGEPGECDKCGEESMRLVCGNCATCRDKFKLG